MLPRVSRAGCRACSTRGDLLPNSSRGSRKAAVFSLRAGAAPALQNSALHAAAATVPDASSAESNNKIQQKKRTVKRPTAAIAAQVKGGAHAQQQSSTAVQGTAAPTESRNPLLRAVFKLVKLVGIQPHEMPKFFAMSGMMFCIIYIFSMSR